MALALKRVRGQDSTYVLTGGGTVDAIKDLKIDLKQGVFDATAADATFDQKVLGRKTLSGSYNMFLGTEGVAPALGDTISVLSVSVGADEVTPATIDDATVYGMLKVTGIGETFQDTPAMCAVSFEGGFI